MYDTLVLQRVTCACSQGRTWSADPVNCPIAVAVTRLLTPLYHTFLLALQTVLAKVAERNVWRVAAAVSARMHRRDLDGECLELSHMFGDAVQAMRKLLWARVLLLVSDCFNSLYCQGSELAEHTQH